MAPPNLRSYLLKDLLNVEPNFIKLSNIERIIERERVPIREYFGQRNKVQ